MSHPDEALVLLNPPGDKRYIRDYFCAKTSKAHYYYHPTDLIYLSGTLSKRFEVHFVDAIAEHLDEATCIERIRAARPRWIVFLTAGISHRNDVAFLQQLHDELPDCGFLGTGDIYREIGSRALRDEAFLDGILFDFSSEAVLRYFDRQNDDPIPDMVYRAGDRIVERATGPVESRFEVAMPRWDLVELDRYSYPFERRRQFASMLTDFGCPYTCSYCPLSEVDFKLRSVDSVIAEIEHLVSLGVRDIYFRDQTFGVHRTRTLELCQRMEPLGVGWTCFTRVDVLDEERARAMRAAGCHTVMFGIETTNEDLLQGYGKNTCNPQVESAIALSKRHGLDVVGFFIIGLPGDGRDSILETIEYARSSAIDFVSFNVAMPRFGTRMREEAIDAGIVEATNLEVDSSTSTPTWKEQPLTSDEVAALQRRAYRAFYLRPGYLFRRLASISTLHQLRNFVREGFSLFAPGRKRA